MPTWRRWLGRFVVVLAVAYPICLLVVILAFRLIGEGWWMTTVAAYLPRIGFALPLPFTAALLLLFRRFRVLWTQLAALLLVVFPLMGLVVSWPSAPVVPHVRVMSWNVDSLHMGVDRVAEEIAKVSPDIVVAQEVFLGMSELETALKARYRFVHASTQFLLATNYPVLEVRDPERIPYQGRFRSPRFMRYLLDTPFGPVAFYNVHPLSPRDSLQQVRSGGLRNGIFSGRLLMGVPAPQVMENAGLRALQVEHIAEMAAGESHPILIAGDTNLPGLSFLYHRFWGRYRDGFADAGSGFGYTFPDKRAWMRIDRILSSQELEFTKFEVGCRGASDHRCVWAEVQRRAQ